MGKRPNKVTFETVSEWKSFGGTQGVYRHSSTETGTPMTFALFVPDHAPGAKLPALWYLSGLTCTHANVMEKGEYRRACAEHGIIFIAPDTSPRGEGVPDADGYDFGQGAGFYVDATQQPWAANFRMRSYIERELPALVVQGFPIDMARQGITGHSMGAFIGMQLPAMAGCFLPARGNTVPRSSCGRGITCTLTTSPTVDCTATRWRWLITCRS